MDAPIVTLTTDWGTHDFYAAKVKGRLYTLIPDVRVVDISHSQAWNNINTAATIVRNGCMEFPAGTAHIIDIGFDQSQFNAVSKAQNRESLLAAYKGHYIISSNRRVLEFALSEPCDQLVSLPFPDAKEQCSFMAYHQYCDVVSRLLSGVAPTEFGDAAEPLNTRMYLNAQTNGNRIEAMVSYIDSFGNVNLNIRYEDFEEIRAGRNFRFELDHSNGESKRFDTISEISRHYSDVRMGELLLTISSTGYIQLAMNKDSASSMMGLSYSSPCSFTFF